MLKILQARPQQYMDHDLPDVQPEFRKGKGLSSQSYGFPVVIYGCESWITKKAECQRIDAFKLWYWRRLLRIPWTARRSNQSILKEINPEYLLKGLLLKLKLQYFGHLMWRTNSMEKMLMLGSWKAGGEGDDRGWDGWMASSTWWTWVWASSGSWQWTGKPGVLQSTGSQRVGRNWATELNSKLLRHKYIFSCVSLTIQFNILLNISIRLTPGQIHKICMRLKYQVIREMKDAWNQDKRTQKSSRRCSHWSKMPKRTNKINNCHKLKYQVYLNPRVHKNI